MPRKTSENSKGGLMQWRPKLVSPPVLAFAALVLLAAAFIAISGLSSPAHLKAVVLSSGQALEGATVDVYSTDGLLVASGVTRIDGSVSFSSPLPQGTLIVKASKEGFKGEGGEQEAIGTINWPGSSKQVVVALFAQPQELPFNDEVSFSVVDAVSSSPIANAVLEVKVGGQTVSYSLSTDERGRALVRVPKGETLVVSVSADNYLSDNLEFVAFRPEQTIRLYSATSLPPGVASLAVSDSGMQSALASVAILDSVKVYVASNSGEPATGAVLLRSSSGQIIASAQLENGFAVLLGVPFSNNFFIEAPSARDGSIVLLDAASGQRLVQSSLNNGRLELGGGLDALGENSLVSLSAVDENGAPVRATFSSGSSSCIGQSCTLVVAAGSEIEFTASAQGMVSSSRKIVVTAGRALQLSFLLVKDGSQVAVNFLGAFDSSGNKVSALLAGEEYSLQFALFSPAAQAASIAVRIGEEGSVSNQAVAIPDFVPPFGVTCLKSTSFSPGSACLDLNNNLPLQGLFKWVELKFESQGEVLQKTIAVPVRVSKSVTNAQIKIFYRASSQIDGALLRAPKDDVAGNGQGAPAACYAASYSATLAVVPTDSCRDGTEQGRCSANAPLQCRRSQEGLKLVPGQDCCPANYVLSQDVCVPSGVVPSQYSCADGTPISSCSNVNFPMYCSSSGLLPSVSCCPQDTIFENGVCRAAIAGCQIATLEFRDGACLPTSPGRCSKSFEQSDAQACGCPDGKAAKGGYCEVPSCADGTPQGQCSQSPQNRLKKCVYAAASVVNSFAQLSLQADASCSCPAGSNLVAGSCAACTTSDCGVAVTCSLNGKKYSQGCIEGASPKYCNAGGSLSDNAVACGCSAGEEFNPVTLNCDPSWLASCIDGTPSGSCSQDVPKRCLAQGGRAFLFDDSLDCGCPVGQVADGVGCRPQSEIPKVSPNPSVSPTPLPLPIYIPVSLLPSPKPQQCSNLNSCVAKDSSSDYCDSQGKLIPNCALCNPSCGGNELRSCDATSGVCSEVSCPLPLPDGTPALKCVQSSQPRRCAIDKDGFLGLSDDSAACGCPKGFKPDSQGASCVECAQDDCSDAPRACVDAYGGRYASGQCLAEMYTPAAFLDKGLLRCNSDGNISPDIVFCGCPAGFARNSDNSACVLIVRPTSLPPLTLDATCRGCVASDTVFFDATTGTGLLRTASGKQNYVMRADTFFPADAFSLNIDQASAPQTISLKTMESASGSVPCYSYDAARGTLSFQASHGGDACPIEVRGNMFYNSRLGAPVETDSLKITLRLESIPPKDLVLEVIVYFAFLESLRVQPVELSSPSTQMPVYLINNKNTAGSRSLGVDFEGGTQDTLLDGAGVKVLGWRGPAGLSIYDQDVLVASLAHQEDGSYFYCAGEFGGDRISKASGPFDCAGSWCSPSAFNQMLESFKLYAAQTAKMTAFRRGGSQPFLSITKGTEAFKVSTAAQVTDPSQKTITSAGVALESKQGCYDFGTPGIYEVAAYTVDGNNFDYRARYESISKADYVGRTCGSDTALCGFVYGACDCASASGHSVLTTLKQNSDERQALDIKPLMERLSPLIDDLGRLLRPAVSTPAGKLYDGLITESFNVGTGDDDFSTVKPDYLHQAALSKLLFSQLDTISLATAPKSGSGNLGVLPSVKTVFAGKSSSPDNYLGDPYSKGNIIGWGAKQPTGFFKLDQTFKDKRKAASDVCWTPDSAGETDSNGVLEKRKPNGEGTEFWVDVDSVNDGKYFELKEDDVRNKGKLLVMVDNCEDEAEKPKENVKDHCYSKIVQATKAEIAKLDEKVEQARKDCVDKCTKDSEDNEGVNCEQLCGEKATYAKKQYPDVGGKLNLCAKALEAELGAGAECEKMPEKLETPHYLVETPAPIERRTAWHKVVAYGVKGSVGGNRDQSGGEQAGSDPGGCFSVCQVKDKFVHVIAGKETSDQVQPYNRYGLTTDCKPVKPNMEGAVGALPPNWVYPFLAQRGYPKAPEAKQQFNLQKVVPSNYQTQQSGRRGLFRRRFDSLPSLRLEPVEQRAAFSGTLFFAEVVTPVALDNFRNMFLAQLKENAITTLGENLLGNAVANSFVQTSDGKVFIPEGKLMNGFVEGFPKGSLESSGGTGYTNIDTNRDNALSVLAGPRSGAFSDKSDSDQVLFQSDKGFVPYTMPDGTKGFIMSDDAEKLLANSDIIGRLSDSRKGGFVNPFDFGGGGGVLAQFDLKASESPQNAPIGFKSELPGKPSADEGGAKQLRKLADKAADDVGSRAPFVDAHRNAGQELSKYGTPKDGQAEMPKELKRYLEGVVPPADGEAPKKMVDDLMKKEFIDDLKKRVYDKADQQAMGKVYQGILDKLGGKPLIANWVYRGWENGAPMRFNKVEGERLSGLNDALGGIYPFNPYAGANTGGSSAANMFAVSFAEETARPTTDGHVAYGTIFDNGRVGFYVTDAVGGTPNPRNDHPIAVFPNGFTNTGKGFEFSNDVLNYLVAADSKTK